MKKNKTIQKFRDKVVKLLHVTATEINKNRKSYYLKISQGKQSLKNKPKTLTSR